MTKNYTSIVSLIFLLFISNSFQAQITLGSDNASNYASWTNGSNAGTANCFTAWDLWTTGTGSAGHFFGDSAAQGFGDVNTSSKAFGMYANPAAGNPQSNAQRFLGSLTGSSNVSGRYFLLPGQSFKIDLAIAFRNGNKGIDLMDNNFGVLFNFKADNDLYVANGTTLPVIDWPYSQTSVFQIEVQQITPTQYILIIKRGSNVYNSGLRTGQFSGIKTYVTNTAAGDDRNNLFFNNMSLIERCSGTTTWNGSSWDNGLPTINKAVAFTGNYTSTANIDACSVSVSNDAVVILADSHTLTVENNVSITGTNSKLIFENNASLLQINPSSTNTGDINFRRKSTPMRQYEYTYWSSPVVGQKLGLFSPLTSTNRFYSFNGDPGVNNYVPENITNPMLAASGYVIMAPANYTSTSQIYNAEFSGMPNNGSYAAPVFAYNIGIKNYNLIGNPYPSAISVASLFSANTNLGALYFWTHNTAISNNVFSSTDYAIRTATAGTVAVSGGVAPGDYVAAGQGFFASSSTNGFVNFNNSMRVANFNTQFYRSNSENKSVQTSLNYYFWLNMTNTDGVFKQMALGYQDNATNGYDFGIDAGAASGTYINFYSLISTNPFAIQGRAYPWNVSDVIPLGYSFANPAPQTSTNFNITLDHNDAFFNDKDIFLKDSTTGMFHNLKTGSYNFTADLGTNFNSRFEIHYQNLLSNKDFDFDANSVYVTTFNESITVNSKSKNIIEIKVYDVLGRLIFDKKQINTPNFSTDSILKQNQALIVKIQLENGVVVSRKLVY
jgi:hypothetical protein